MCDCLEKEKICPLYQNQFYASSNDEEEEANRSWDESEKNVEDNSSKLSSISEYFEETKELSSELDDLSYGKNYKDDGDTRCDDPYQKWKVVAKKLRIHKKSLKKVKKERGIEFTLAIIKPDAVQYQRIIKKIIIDEGFEICNEKKLQMTADQMFEFYSREDGKSELSAEIDYMVSGPIIVLVLCKHQAVNEWIDLIGPPKVSDAILYFPDSIRAKFGNNKQDDYKNAVHGSTSYEIAQKEIKFFFPNFIFEPILTGNALESYFQDNICEILSKGIIHCCEVKTEDPLLCLSNWLLENNPNKPKMVHK